MRNQNEQRNDQVEGTTSYNNGVVTIQYWRNGGGIDYNTMAHELKHGYQFEKGELSFKKTNGKAGYLYDITDEQAAWKRGSAFDGSPMLKIYTIEDLQDGRRYKNCPLIPLNSSMRTLNVMMSWGYVPTEYEDIIDKNPLFKDSNIDICR